MAESSRTSSVDVSALTTQLRQIEGATRTLQKVLTTPFPIAQTRGRLGIKLAQLRRRVSGGLVLRTANVLQGVVSVNGGVVRGRLS